jgi:hypothetical protein
MSDTCHAVTVEISPAELLDRITILRIKLNHQRDSDKKSRIASELHSFEAARSQHVPESPQLAELVTELSLVNESLWSVEDRIRQCRAAADRDGFVESAETILRLNDERSSIKRRINVVLGSLHLEEKRYPITSAITPIVQSATLCRS